MKISAAIREYLIEIEVRKYTPKTIRGYRNGLNLFLRFCEQEAHIQEVEEINLAVRCCIWRITQKNAFFLL